MVPNGVDSKTRLEILRLISELDNPVGAETLVGGLADRGISITVDAVRYHLRLLDQQGYTAPLGNRGRTLTQEGREELRRSMVDSRMRSALAQVETMAQQVTFDPDVRNGLLAVSVVLFPEEHLYLVLRNTIRATRAGLCVSDRVALLHAGQKVGGVLVPTGKVGLMVVAASTIDGFLLSRGFLFRRSFGGTVEIAGWRPHRFVDVMDYGLGSLDPIEVLARPGRTGVLNAMERGHGLMLGSVREMLGVARDRVMRALHELQGTSLGGIMAVGQVGQPILGVPVQQHTFGIVVAASINAVVASMESGVAVEVRAQEAMVEYESLRSVEELLPEPERNELRAGDKLRIWRLGDDSLARVAMVRRHAPA